jgi:hypothetical protein
MKQLLNFLALTLFIFGGCVSQKKPIMIENEPRPITWEGLFNTGDAVILGSAISFSTENQQSTPQELKTDTVDVAQILKDTSNTADTIYYLGERVCNYKTGLTEKVLVMQIESFTYYPEALINYGVTTFVESKIRYFAKSLGNVVFDFSTSIESDWVEIFSFEDFVWIKQESHP